jgi:D-amino-acid dehydrogenase
LRADVHQWLWGLSFLRECLPERTRHNIVQLVNLGLYSRATLQALRAETGIQYDQLTRGILHFYTSQREFDAAQEPARIMREFGCDLDMVTASECVAIEPALGKAGHMIVGGSMTASDESGDAHLFTRNLAALCEKAGVRFEYGTQVVSLVEEGGALSGVTIKRAGEGFVRREKADAYVVAMGSYSAQLLRPVGVHLNIYPAKGYSATLRLLDQDSGPHVSLTDDEYKIVFSRLGDRLRVAGTAELNGYDTSLNMVRCQALVRRVEQLFPGMVDTSDPSYWTGLRPATPSNVPYIGPTQVGRLFVNTGHGTLGWTHSCGSGRAIAELVSGRVPDVDFAFTNAPRRSTATATQILAHR